ncbi:MAG: sulfotransferase family 2 domain-containing protein [Lysobacterales bacterium]
MVISHKHRYVFVQVMKTASTAIARELCLHYDGEPIFDKHTTIADFYREADPSWKDYSTFAGVRHPLDVAVSRYLLRKQGRQNGFPANLDQHRFISRNNASFSAYLKEYTVRRAAEGFDIGMVPMDWKSKRFQSIDYIYRYENLASEFPAILRKLGITPVRSLPMFNVTEGKQKDLSVYLDDEAREIAESVFGEYMKRWGYTA